MPLTGEFVQNALLILSVVTGIVMFIGREVSSSKILPPKPSEGIAFRRFQNAYLCVYSAAVFSDWLQGPYVYALYESYGYTPWDNAVLFVAGYSSSMTFGTVVGSLADWTGRRRGAVLYCVLYIVHNLTKHVNSYRVLMLGRFAGGIATSLLFSVFDSWLVCEHNRRGFDPALLSETFSWAVFVNAFAAILAGVVAQSAADYQDLTPPGAVGGFHMGGYCGPFDVSVGSLVLCGVLAQALWCENYGQQNSKGGGAASPLQSARQALQICLSDAAIICCGAVCALFEAAMFIFIFQWTPALTEPGGAKPPYGLIFAAFMVPCMLGSSIFSMASRVLGVERIGQGVLLLALGSHLVPAFGGDSTLSFCAFLVFELSVGIYFPMIGTLKGRIVPDEWRSTIYSFYRAPMNLMVLGMLTTDSEPRSSFRLTSLMLCVALGAQTRLLGSVRKCGKHGGLPASQAMDARHLAVEVEALGAPCWSGVADGGEAGGVFPQSPWRRDSPAGPSSSAGRLAARAGAGTPPGGLAEDAIVRMASAESVSVI